MSRSRAIVIGSGLAGMTVAYELLKRGMPVVVLDAGSRPGGKAGADPVRNTYEEHGFHVFPAWYLNTRQLLRELRVDGDLIDLDSMHHLQKGRFPELVTYYSPTTARGMVHNVVNGLLPWHEALAVMYCSVDLCSQSFSQRAFLDRISVSGFLRSRFYRSEDIAKFHQLTVLQAGAVPSCEMSAMSMQHVLNYWIAHPSPVFSLLNGNLHERCIEPFMQRLRHLHADIQFNRRVTKLLLKDGRVAGVQFDDGSRLAHTGRQDIFVLATPPEVTRTLVNQELYAVEDETPETDDAPPRLADTVHLQSVPMAALNLYLNRRVPGIPKEHVTLYDSRYQLSFVDVSQHWPGLPCTTLSLIASNFAPLAGLPAHDAARYLIKELRAFVPVIHADDIERHYLQPNVDDPLFLNTVGAWTYRPGTRTRIDNLYTAGDYCRSEADITTMESAVMSGLCTARDILQDEGLDADVGLIHLQSLPRNLLLLMKYAGLLAIAPVGLYYSVRRHLRGE